MSGSMNEQQLARLTSALIISILIDGKVKLPNVESTVELQYAPDVCGADCRSHSAALEVKPGLHSGGLCFEMQAQAAAGDGPW
jgi:hypothetical protein